MSTASVADNSALESVIPLPHARSRARLQPARGIDLEQPLRPLCRDLRARRRLHRHIARAPTKVS